MKGARERWEALRNALPYDLPGIAVSLHEGESWKELPAFLFRLLGVIRVYTKKPGQQPARERPFILEEGSTVLDLAEEVHQDLVRKFRYARVWGSAEFPGQQVERTYVLRDGDIVEIHA